MEIRKKRSTGLLKDKKKKIQIITVRLIHLYVRKWITQPGARIINQSHVISGTKELQEPTLKHVWRQTERLRKQTKIQFVATFVYTPH